MGLLYWRADPCVDGLCPEAFGLRAAILSEEILEVSAFESLTNESSDAPGWYMPALEIRISSSAFSRIARASEVTKSELRSLGGPTVVSFSSRWELVVDGRTNVLPNGFLVDDDKIEFDWFMLDPELSMEDLVELSREWMACPPAV